MIPKAVLSSLAMALVFSSVTALPVENGRADKADGITKRDIPHCVNTRNQCRSAANPNLAVCDDQARACCTQLPDGNQQNQCLGQIGQGQQNWQQNWQQPGWQNQHWPRDQWQGQPWDQRAQQEQWRQQNQGQNWQGQPWNHQQQQEQQRQHQEELRRQQEQQRQQQEQQQREQQERQRQEQERQRQQWRQ